MTKKTGSFSRILSKVGFLSENGFKIVLLSSKMDEAGKEQNIYIKKDK
jgi:hypothetical protein